MKNKLIKISVKIIISFLLIINLIGQPASAQDTGKELLCQRDWGTFISSVISYDGFTEYWKDIFYRYNKNICYYMDINNVLNQLEKAREQIRNAFYTCNYTRADELKPTYYALEAELFFLRNYVDLSKSELTKIDDKKVYEALRNNFVINKSYFDEKKVKELFEQFKTKYQDRVKTTYKNCADPGLAALSDKWKSLTESFKAMGATGQGIEDQWKKSINSPVKRTGNALQGYLDFRINKLPPKEAVNQIYESLKKDYNKRLGVKDPNKQVEPELVELQNTILKKEEDYNKKVQQANLMAKYEGLYKKGGDTLSEEFKLKLQELDKIIKDTYPTLDNLYMCSKGIADKQCK